jgi:hypothetical protein
MLLRSPSVTPTESVPAKDSETSQLGRPLRGTQESPSSAKHLSAQSSCPTRKEAQVEANRGTYHRFRGVMKLILAKILVVPGRHSSYATGTSSEAAQVEALEISAHSLAPQADAVLCERFEMGEPLVQPSRGVSQCKPWLQSKWNQHGKTAASKLCSLHSVAVQS